jgi:hypothetical protein
LIVKLLSSGIHLQLPVTGATLLEPAATGAAVLVVTGWFLSWAARRRRKDKSED